MSRFFKILGQQNTIQYQEHDLPFIIGSGADAHIKLNNVAESVAYIGISQGHLFIQPADTETVFHNNEHIQNSAWIKSGDFSQISSSLLRYTISGDQVLITLEKAENLQNLTTPFPIPPIFAVQSIDQKQLPRIAPAPKNKNRNLRKSIKFFLTTFFAFLILASIFLLTAKSVQITIDPIPDKVSFPLFSTIITFNKSFLALPGSYLLIAEKRGYHPLDTNIKVTSNGTNQFRFSMGKLPGYINVLTDPQQGITFAIDGIALDNTSLSNIEIAAGTRQIEFSHKRYKTLKKEIEIEGQGKRQSFSFKLDPAWAQVNLTSDPSSAQVTADTIFQGETPLALELLEGEHLLLFHKPEYSDKELSLTIIAGIDQTPDTVVLTPAPATLEVLSKPSGSTIVLDKIYQGITPLKLILTSKETHTLVLNLAGYEQKHTQILLAPGEHKTISHELTPEYSTIFLTSSPSDAKFFINGQQQEKSTGRFQLPVGEHTIELNASGYNSETRKISLQKGFSQQLDINLVKKDAQFTSVKQTSPQLKKIKKGLILMGTASFQMGSSRRDPGRRANEILRQVRITQPFYLAEKNVTNKEYRLFQPNHTSGNFKNNTLNDAEQPVVNISWEDAARYLNWLSRQEGLEPFYLEKEGTIDIAKPLTNGYRLPTEAEWTYAARFAEQQAPAKYPWAGSFPPVEKIGNFGDESAGTLLPIILKGYTDSYPVTAPVGSFPKNPAGFFDFGGNTSEWCHDYYTPYTGFANLEETDPTGPTSGSHHVIRGSSWRDATITELRLSYRNYSKEGRDDISFRAARYAW